jgi:arsenate reductase-like glutaredoxin family protein
MAKKQEKKPRQKRTHRKDGTLIDYTSTSVRSKELAKIAHSLEDSHPGKKWQDLMKEAGKKYKEKKQKLDKEHEEVMTDLAAKVEAEEVVQNNS